MEIRQWQKALPNWQEGVHNMPWLSQKCRWWSPGRSKLRVGWRPSTASLQAVRHSHMPLCRLLIACIQHTSLLTSFTCKHFRMLATPLSLLNFSVVFLCQHHASSSACERNSIENDAVAIATWPCIHFRAYPTFLALCTVQDSKATLSEPAALCQSLSCLLPHCTSSLQALARGPIKIIWITSGDSRQCQHFE